MKEEKLEVNDLGRKERRIDRNEGKKMSMIKRKKKD